MGPEARTKFTSLFAISGILLLTLPPFAAVAEYPLYGIDVHIRPPDLKQYRGYEFLLNGPYTPETDPDTGVFIRDIEALCRNGTIPEIRFTLGIAKGHPPVNLSSCRIHFMGSKESIYYTVGDDEDDDYGKSLKYSPIKDPDGLLGMGLLNENATVLVTLGGVDEVPNGQFSLYFQPSWGRVSQFKFFIPRFLTEPPYDSGRNDSVRIIDSDGSFPRPSENDWLITNETILENVNFTLEKNLTIADNGSLVLRNSTFLVNTSYGHNLAITVGVRGSLAVFNSTLDALNKTGESFWYGMFYIVVFGQLTLENASIHFSTLSIYSDEATVSGCILDCHFTCNGCSPRIIDNSIHQLTLSESSPLIRDNVFGNASRIGSRTNNETAGYRDLMLWDYSNPSIEGNVFQNLDVGISSYRYSNPRITGNRFTGCDIGISFEGNSYGLVDGNRFENATTGISVGYAFSAVTLSNNDISARHGVKIELFNTVKLVNNTFREYVDYGIFSNNSFTRAEGNRFIPASNATKGSRGAVVQWLLVFDVVDEKLKKRLPFVLIDITVKNAAGSVQPSLAKPLEPAAAYMALVPEYIITNKGKTARCNPYTITVRYLGHSSSIELKVDKVQTFYLVMTQNVPPITNATYLLLLILGSGLSYKSFAPGVKGWVKARKMRKANRRPAFPPPVKFSADIIEWSDDQ